MAVTAGLAIAGLALKGYSMYKSSQAEDKARSQLNNLYKTPAARYSVSPQVRQMAEQAYGEASNPTGYTGAQTNSFKQNLAMMLHQRQQNALGASGGSGSKAITGILNGQETLANNQFVENDPTRLNRQNALNRLQYTTGIYQRNQDMNTSQDINYRMQTERALGTSIAQQSAYFNNSVASAGDTALSLSGNIYGQKYGQPKVK